MLAMGAFAEFLIVFTFQQRVTLALMYVVSRFRMAALRAVRLALSGQRFARHRPPRREGLMASRTFPPRYRASDTRIQALPAFGPKHDCVPSCDNGPA